MADKHTIPKVKMHRNCRLLPGHIVCKITQRNNIRRANTYDPALKLLNEEITSDILKHKQNLWKEHLNAHWSHRHNRYILWHTIHRLSNRARPPTQNTSITFNIKKQPHTYCELFHQTILTKLSKHTQHTRQTEQHIKYKDITSHSPQLRSKRQYNKVKITTHKVLTR